MKKIFRYVMIYVPFILGIILFSFKIVNLFSSFCLCIGGYIAIKNTFDYRMVKKNMEYGNEKVIKKNSENIIIGDRKCRKRERVRVRKK